MTFLQPVPSLQRRPFDLGGLISGTFGVYKRAFGAFVGLAALALAVVFVPLLAFLIPMVIGIAESVQTGRPAWVWLIGGGLLAIAAVFAASLFSARCSAMMCVATEEVVAQRRPTFVMLWARTRGYMGRLLVFALLVGLVVLVAYGVLIGIVFGMAALFAAAVADDKGGLVAVGVLVGIALYLGVLIGAVWLQVKLTYFQPAMALEGRDGFDAWRRSWSMTRNHFWRTLGWIIVGVGIAYTIVYLISYFAQMMTTIPLMISTSQQSRSADPTQVLWSMIPSLIASALVQLAVMLLYVPYVQIFVTLLFIDQRNRDEMVAAGIPMAGTYGPAHQAPTAPPAQSWPTYGPGYPGQPGGTYQPGGSNQPPGSAGPEPGDRPWQ